MLGYDLEDLNISGLKTSLSFLEGLWAEGYFDGYQD